MNISRFFGTTTREAMRQVRLALGPDALIVSNRRVNGGVEILAADSSSVPEAGAVPEAQPVQRSVPLAPAPAANTTMPSPAMPSPMSPMGAYAAAVQAAYGPGVTGGPGADGAPAPAVGTAGMAAGTGTSAAVSSAATAATATAARPASPAGSHAAFESSYSSAAASGRAAEPAVGGQLQPDVMDAIGEMRGALETRIDELLWGNQLRRAPQAASLFQSLLGFGFSTALLRAMLKRLPEQLAGRAAFHWARQELISHLPVLGSEDDLWKPGLALALVGPTGVGKTTTIAKLAARCVRRFGPDRLVLVTTDTYRIGAHEQLKIYGEMLRVPVHVVRNANELRGVMQGIRPDQLILIDNVGISQRDRYVSEQAAMLAAAGRDITRLLVLNAASHGETLDEVARSYAADGGTPLKGCIITKVDEAIRLGAALDTALRYRLPIHYVSIGQKVPEHLVFLQAAELVDRALTHQPSARSLYAPTEADFAALLSMSRPADAVDPVGSADARRQQMQALPRLLSMAAGAADQLKYEDLRDGCAFIDDLACASEAYNAWRGYTEADADAAKAWLQSSLRHMLRIIQNEWAESGHKHLLAVHGTASLHAAGESPAKLWAALVLNEQGVPLSSPMQQLALPTAWLSSCGAVLPQDPAARHALRRQLDWLHHEAVDLPLIHLLEGGGPVLWRELTEMENAPRWLAQVPAITRIHMEDGATTVQALAKTLAHHPVPDPDYLFALAEVAGSNAASRALWAATATVSIASRGKAPLQLQLVSARLVDRESGKRVRSMIGLHPGLEVSPDKLAAWLVLKAESREALRHIAAIWALLAAQNQHAPLQQKALVAAQAGLAAWQLRASPLAEEGRKVAAAMLGKQGLAPAAASGGLLKLFALKEMMGG